MSRRRQQVFLCLLLGSLLIVLLRIAWPFGSSLVLAVLLATVLGPANYRLIRILRRRGLASLLTTLATVIVMEVIFGFVCYRVVKDAMKIQHTLNQRSVEEGGWGAMVAHFNRSDRGRAGNTVACFQRNSAGQTSMRG